MAFIHPIVQAFAIVIGLYTGYLGWQRFRKRTFQWKRHIRLGFIFFMMILLGAIVGFGTTFFLEGGVFRTGLHALLPFIIVPFLSIGVIIGFFLSKGQRKGGVAVVHMCINFFAMLLILLQAYLGIGILVEIIRMK